MRVLFVDEQYVTVVAIANDVRLPTTDCIILVVDVRMVCTLPAGSGKAHLLPAHAGRCHGDVFDLPPVCLTGGICVI